MPKDLLYLDLSVAMKRLGSVNENEGLVRDLNPGPRAPEARIIPLDQRARCLGNQI